MQAAWLTDRQLPRYTAGLLFLVAAFVVHLQLDGTLSPAAQWRLVLGGTPEGFEQVRFY